MLLSGVLALPVAACAGAYSDLPIATAGPADRYTLGPGDSIKIAVYGFDAMAGSYTVSDAGVKASTLDTLDDVAWLPF